MAITKILARRGGLSQAIAYVLNGDKTEEQILTAAQGCLTSTACHDMAAVKQRWNKTDGVQLYHVIQSFRPGELSPELALEIAREFAREHLPGYQAVIGVHTDREHIHAHIVFNSVNQFTGEKYHSNAQSYYQQIRGISDRLCRERGLSVIMAGESAKAVSYVEWLRRSITDCISKKVKKNQGERAMYYVENNHPAIISREVFDQVRNEMTRRSSKRKVLQKSGKTELGKYSGKYALTELLVCGECGSPYKRVTWARNGKKRIVWRCVSRLEFGTKYCHNSPTLDESKLHSAILAAMNEFAAIRQEVCPDVLAMAEEAKQALSQAGAKLLELKKHLEAVSREQSDLLDRLLENMGDAELNAKMKALTDEKESLKAQILDTQQMEVSLEEQATRHQQMWDSIMECSAGYTEFDDEFVRQIIQKITVEDEETIRIHFRDSEMVMEQEL